MFVKIGLLLPCLYYKCVAIVIYDHSNSSRYYKCVKAHVLWWHFLVKMLVTVTDYLLALATLGDMTKKKNDPISVAPPMVPKASSLVSLSLALSH